jgi:hypothetical protein
MPSIKNLQERIKWLEHGLQTIASTTTDELSKKRAIAFLDGEPTTADEFNGDCMITYVDDRENNELLEL